jgi:hypothetical protein
MKTLLDFAALLLLTVAVGVLALVLDWMLLRAAFRLMRPAGASRRAAASVSAGQRFAAGR